MNYNLNIRLLTALVMLVLWVGIAYSQDVSSIKNAKPITINGAVNVNQVVYGVKGIESRRDPYNYYINGSLNINLYGIIQTPLTFMYSNHKAQFSQPFNFNQFGLSPSYKWIKTYIGYNTMSFSSYTFNGHQFLGGGIELTPPKYVRFAAMYGRLLKKVEADSLNSSVIPAYRRMGGGAKIGFFHKSNFVDLIFFKAKDDPQSLSFIPQDPTAAPKENLALGILAGAEWQQLKFTAELAASSVTRDARAGLFDSESGIFKYTDFIQSNRTSTSNFNAMKYQLAYSGGGFTVGTGYERVGPDYQTFGAYYFSNDLENITLNVARSFFNGKMNVAMNGGKQRNNLNNDKLSQFDQYVASANVAANPSKRLNLNASFSNFSSFTNIRSTFDYINQSSPYANIDTLNFTQLSQQASLSASVQLGNLDSKQSKQQLMANISAQQATDKQNQVDQHTGAAFFNMNTAYAFSFIPASLNIQVNVNANLTSMQNNETKTYGPTLSVSKMLLQKKINTQLSSSFNQSFQNEKKINQVFSFRWSVNYIMLKKHRFNAGLIFINRAALTAAYQDFHELTGTLGYNYSF